MNRFDESGMTLVEVLVASSLLMIVLGSVLGVMTTVQRGYEKEVDRAQSVDQARLAMEQIQHEVASANAVTVVNGLSMDVYTRTNQTTRTASASPVCVQWRVSSGALQSRTWLPGDPAVLVMDWRTVATDLTNTATGPGILFQLDPNTAYANRLVNITARVNTNAASGSDVVISGSALGRNIQYGVPDPCATSQP